MQNTIRCTRGDVVLVEFIFSDEAGTKVRPAIVLSTPRYHRARHEVILAAVTSNTNRRLFGDRLVGRWREAGLAHPSVATGILRTVTEQMIYRRIGALHPDDLLAVDAALRGALGL